jgi:hypothetical protein
VAEHDELLEAAERARVEAEARAKGAAEALAAVEAAAALREKAGERLRNRVTFWLSVAGAVAAASAWAATHFLHL